MKYLIIVESPAKAQKIQSFLNKDNYKVLSSKGHITDLAKGGNHGIGINIENNFYPNYVLMSDKVNILQELLDAAKKADLIYLAGDPDREGTMISHQIYERLKDINKPFKRVLFREIKKSAIQKAIAESGDINMNIVHSALSRRIIDRIVGFMASPYLMNIFGEKLSAGRVQSVVTKMVIDREREIESFVPEDFWTIQTSLSKNSKEGFIAKYSGRLTNKQLAEDMNDRLSSAEEYVVSEVLAEELKRAPNEPLITSSLQRLMSRKHNFPADRTMKAAQSLYESGYCSYIRTDSVRSSEESIKEVRDWLSSNSFQTPKKANSYKNKDAAQDAHECIRPSDISSGPVDSSILNQDEKLVYEEVWRHFVASQMLPAVYNTLKITAHVKNDKSAEVKASGKALKSAGFLDILGVTDDSKIDIPNLSKGDILHLFGKNPVKLEKKQTQPPPRFSEDKLIKELDQKSIGRPATYAELLSKISSRNYVEKRGNVFHATDLGKKITDELSEYFTFMNYDYTKNMEKSLDEIEHGKLNYLDMLNKFYPIFKAELDKAYTNHGKPLCEKCRMPMVIKTAKVSKDKFWGCSGFPKCKFIKNIS